ncbi:MAG: hypothetical protein M3024_06850, partial [Candidatus Dormibacteraeota bacterium]|nr:hypothetical protein [Candidatus Dormibacteraeota bacterium]
TSVIANTNVNALPLPRPLTLKLTSLWHCPAAPPHGGMGQILGHELGGSRRLNGGKRALSIRIDEQVQLMRATLGAQ